MKQFGENLRRRARELGLSDVRVARLVDLSERRYGFYVTGDREPDLETLLRIAHILQVPTDELLRSPSGPEPGVKDILQDRLNSFAANLPEPMLRLLVDTAEVFSQHGNTSSDANG